MLDGIDSLKAKRSIVAPVLARLRRHFNLAAAEVDDLDRRDCAVIGFTVVSNDVVHASRVIEAAMAWVDTEAEAPLGDYHVEYLHVF